MVQNVKIAVFISGKTESQTIYSLFENCGGR